MCTIITWGRGNRRKININTGPSDVKPIFVKVFLRKKKYKFSIKTFKIAKKAHFGVVKFRVKLIDLDSIRLSAFQVKTQTKCPF